MKKSGTIKVTVDSFPCIIKFLIIMKLIVFFQILGFINVFSATYSQVLEVKNNLSADTTNAFPQTDSSYMDSIHTYKGEYLTGIDFPVGALGGGVIRMNGKAERTWWQIFNNYEERPGSGIVPNSFFAIRTNTGGSTVVRVLQTSSVGPFSAMESLSFQGEYPFGWYNFVDCKLPVNVKLEAYNPLIPMDLKNSAIPCAIFRITVKNTSAGNVDVSLLGSQQNAVGFNGYDTIAGINNRNYKEYGSNYNTIVSDATSTSLKMTGINGSMQLSAYETGMTHTASWDSLTSLFNDFSVDGILTGPSNASGPAYGVTVDGAISKDFILTPGQERTITFVLSWYFPNGTFGLKDKVQWSNLMGSQYENSWTDANSVDSYVRTNFNTLDFKTRLYHNALYSSKIPRYAIDRISSNLCVLKSPTVFWAKNGYFGIWESTSDRQVWWGNPNYVTQYAQGIAYFFPELGKILREQELNTQTDKGLIPARTGDSMDAQDGHLGTILSIYREHLLSNDNTWLNRVWAKTKRAMDYTIATYDINEDGMFSGGLYDNSMDCITSGTNPWIGSMYLAALKACAKMADIEGDTVTRERYYNIFTTGTSNQNSQLWNSNLNYYVEKSENLPGSFHFGNACDINMFLGQWWANQLNLGQIYPKGRTTIALSQIFTNNKYTDPGFGYAPHFRDFLGTGDTGWIMHKHPGSMPSKPVLYYDEAMSGFEYTLAAELIQYGMIKEGMTIVKSLAKRYDGRLRGCNEVHCASNSTVYGCGSPFGEDECGDFYVRALSSWSVLTALQGFIYDGPKQIIGFKPTWRPDDHSSFFTASSGWGLFTQTRTFSNQSSKINVKYGSTVIKNIILSTPDNKTASNILVKLNGIDQSISSSNLSDNTLTINLSTACTVNSGSNLTISFFLDE